MTAAVRSLIRPQAAHLRRGIDHFGLIYYHANQAVQLATLLGVVLDTKPLPFYAYLDDVSGAYWRGPNAAGGNAGIPPHIAIGGHTPAGGVSASDVNNGSRPDNREWHEFGHHFMADAFGNLLPVDGPRVNHDGYKNTTTSDSWIEGFAEFSRCSSIAKSSRTARHPTSTIGRARLRTWKPTGSVGVFATRRVLRNLPWPACLGPAGPSQRQGRNRS